MPEPPRRKRFQIHLSTAIVLMFTAGGLIWANVFLRIGTTIGYMIEPPSPPAKDQYVGKTPYYLGWPCAAFVSESYAVLKANGDVTHTKTSENSLIVVGIAIDAIVALLILFSIWYVCEWLIRRRAARKGA